MKVTIIGSAQLIERMFLHEDKLLSTEGDVEVRMPIFDSDRQYSELEMIEQNRANIEWADEVHMLWDRRSTGTIFDFGMCFALRKPLKIVYLEEKTFEGIMKQYESQTEQLTEKYNHI